MSPTNPVLETKVQIPQLPPQLVPRARLFETLDTALQPFRRLTLLSAPTGYGKTSLVSAWVQDRRLPTAWLSLDEQDNDPTRFTNYLLAALEKADPRFNPPDLAAGPYAEGEFEASTLIPMLNQMGESERTTLVVLDDYHWIESSTVHLVVGYLLEHLPTQAHMVILTRADPPLPIARLRSRGQLLELRMEDLRFQTEEVQTFLGWFSDVRLTPDQTHILTQRTEGWIAGIQMAAASLRGHADQGGFIRSFSGDDHYIMDFLLDEVLRRQAPQLQVFLLNTSILPRLCGSLCDALLEGSNEESSPSKKILVDLEHANLFIIPLDEKREWYRYHRLFSDLLQARLQHEGPEHIRALHRRASQWFEGKNLLDEAVQHALLSEDSVLAADLLERASQELLMRSETATLLRWLQRLPREEIASRPRLGIYLAWALLFQAAPLSVVEAQLPKGGEDRDPPGGAALLGAFVALAQGKIAEGLELAEHAYEVLPQEEIYLRHLAAFCVAGARISSGDEEGGQSLLETTTLAAQGSGNPSAAVLFLCELAEMRLKQMQLDESRDLYLRALNAATDPEGRRLPIAGRALIGLGDLALERYDLDEAERLLAEGVELTERWSLISTLEAHLFMATLHHARGQWKELKESFELLFDLARRFDASDVDDRVVELVEASLKARQGEFEAVRAWVSRRGLEEAPQRLSTAYAEDHLTSRIYKYELPVLVRLLIADKKYEDAHQAIETLIELAEKANRPFLVLEAEILRALLLHTRGEAQASYAALRRALALARPSQAMRLFLTEGDTLIDLLRTGRPTWDTPDLLEFTDRLLRRSDARRASSTDGPEALSPRELDVLQLLPSELTVDDMAKELVVTGNTVRSHLKSIYAKLGVHSRHQAVERARHLDLL
jgi:LuxR family maltose regulon positive regulatory protein